MCGLAAAFVLLTFPTGSASQAAEPVSQRESEAFRNAIAARLEQIQNMLVDYELETRYAPYPNVSAQEAIKVSPQGGGMLLKTGTEESARKFSFLKGQARYESTMSPETSKRYEEEGRAFFRRQIFLSAAGRTEELLVRSKISHPMGVIRNSQKLRDSAIDVAMGLRGRGEQEWLTPESLLEAKVSKLRNGNLVTTQVLGQYQHEWEYNPNQAFMLVAYRARMKVSGRLVLECAASGLQVIDGLPMPKEIVETEHSYAYKTHRVIRTRTLRIKQIRLNDPMNVREKYQLVWPKGTSVLDERIMLEFNVTSGGRVLTDEDIYSRTIESMDVSLGASSGPVAKTMSAASAPALQGTLDQSDRPVASGMQKGLMRTWILAVSAVVVIGVVVVLFFRRCRRIP